MWDLAIGDMVKVADNKYEPVYSFGHKEAGLESDFISISTKGSRKALEMSEDHMVVVEGGRNVPASMIAVGDMLVTSSGELAAVKSIRIVTRMGAFAPFTRSGSIVVNDLVVSNYVAFNGSEYFKIAGVETPFSFQWLAHIFNSVHRVAYMMGFKGETYTEVGVSHWVEAGHNAAGWLLEQNPFVMLCVLLAGIIFFGTVSIIEAALLSPVTTAALVAGAVLARPFASFKATAKKA
jgi:Hint module